MPAVLGAQLDRWQQGGLIDQPVRSWLAEQGILVAPEPETSLFPLTEVRPEGWTNSRLGEAWLETIAGPATVLDALSWADLEALPQRGPLLYLEDPRRGLWVPQTATEDGRIPCARCLMRRYLAGRHASLPLFEVLQGGARVAWPNREPREGWPEGEGWITLDGRESSPRILPLPDCPDCLRRAAPGPVAVGLWGPVSRCLSQPPSHRAELGQMAWLCGQPTVGEGGAYDDQAERGRRRALHEAWERYAAHWTPPSSSPQGVPFASSEGEGRWPLWRAVLTEPGSVSTGLACRQELELAIADGLAEVCERDALARWWLDLECGLARMQRLPGGPRSALRSDWEVRFYRLDSYHVETVLCLGQGAHGVVLGSGAGPQARAKAEHEMWQNLNFLESRDASPQDPPETFEEHAALYFRGCRPWPDLSGALSEGLEPRPLPAPVFHADLTPPDLALLGVRAVRVLVPGLIYPPMSHHDWHRVLTEVGGLERRPPQAPHPFL